MPEKINVIIEIAKGSKKKYELSPETGSLLLDRELKGTMVYPENYGFIPETLAEDGDPVDVLILSRRSYKPKTIILVTPIGLLKMEDEEGTDSKILCLSDKSKIKNLSQIPCKKLKQIENFFKHYKELETGKWVRVGKWQNKEEVKKYILEAAKRYRKVMGNK